MDLKKYCYCTVIYLAYFVVYLFLLKYFEQYVCCFCVSTEN